MSSVVPKNIMLITLVIFMFSSCVGRKKIIYFQNELSGSKDVIQDLTLEIGDILSVDIIGTDPEVAKPFNQVELVRQGNQNTTYDNGIPVSYGYLIQSDGMLSLPIVGKVKAAGMSREAFITYLEEKLTFYLEKPQVSVRLLNFKITVLGEVDNPGTFNVPNERLTIIEALGIAKDLKITGQRNNILVIRHEQGEKKTYRIDLTQTDFFNSPVYYLKQNDVIYVEPNRKSRYEASVLRTAGGVIISATSLIVSTLILIQK